MYERELRRTFGQAGCLLGIIGWLTFVVGKFLFKGAVDILSKDPKEKLLELNTNGLRGSLVEVVECSCGTISERIAGQATGCPLCKRSLFTGRVELEAPAYASSVNPSASPSESEQLSQDVGAIILAVLAVIVVITICAIGLG